MPLSSASGLRLPYKPQPGAFWIQSQKKTIARRLRTFGKMEKSLGFNFALVLLLLCCHVEKSVASKYTECARGKAMDIVFLIDGNLNRDAASLDNIRGFLSKVSNSIDLNAKTSRFLVFTFSRQTSLVLDSAAFDNNHNFSMRLQQIKVSQKGPILLRRALRIVKRHLFSSKTRSRWRERPAMVFAVVGKASKDPAIEMATLLRQAGVRIAAIGLDKAVASELLPITSEPDHESVIMLSDTNELPGNGSEFALSLICTKFSKPETILTNAVKKANVVPNAPSNDPNFNIGSATIGTNTITIHTASGNTPPLRFDVSIMPKEATLQITLRERMIILSGLSPATEYSVTITSVYSNTSQFTRQLTYTTDQEKVTNLRTNLITDPPCDLQGKLMLTYGAMAGVVLARGNCLPSSTDVTIEVEWERIAGNAVYQVLISPELPHLITMPATATKRFFTGAKAGVKYRILVVAQSNNISTQSWTDVVIPPLSPRRIEVQRVSSTEVRINTFIQALSEFDGIDYEVVSPYGRFSVRHDLSSRLRNSTRSTHAYPFTISNLAPCSPHVIRCKTASHGVKSSPVIARLARCSEAEESPPKVLESSFILSTSDGVYAVSSSTSEQSEPQMLVSAPGGVVNAVLHRHKTKAVNRNTVADNKNYWAYSIIWIDRKTRSIKTTYVDSPSNTKTIVSGLLQPVGLALDLYDDNVYWTDIAGRSIGVARLTTTTPGVTSISLDKRLVTTYLYTPIGLAVDPVGRNLFWADLWGRIERSDMDGSNRKILLTDPIIRPQSLIFSQPNKRLLWVDSSFSSINSMSSDGGVVLTTTPSTDPHTRIQPTSLTLLNNHTFVVSAEHKIYQFDRIPSDASYGEESSFSLVLGSLSGLTSITTQDYEAYEDALMDNEEDPLFLCSSNMHSCEEVCISQSIASSTCVGQCHPWETLCANSTQACVSTILVCDGTNDCPNGEDEDSKMCRMSQIAPEECADASMLLCENQYRCVENSVVCDGRLDCRDGSDEVNCPVQEQKCDFEEDFCLWSQASDDDFDWILWHGRTPSNKTGPILDHTMLRVNSTYILAEATQYDEGSKASLISTWFWAPVCVEFSYHMFGEGMGSLSLSAMDKGANNTETMWRSTGNQGVFWKQASVSINRHGLYQLVFQAVRGKDFRSDVALDDVIVRDGLCNVSHSCTFDQSACGFEGANKKDSKWSILSEVLPVFNKGSLVFEKSSHEILDENPVEELGPEWFYFDFELDDTPGCSECDGVKLVRQISSFGAPKFTGIVLCSSTRYKIYLSETLHGVFRNVADGFGSGEDHCEFVGADDYAHRVGEYIHCQGVFGYRRIDFFEHVAKGIFGPHHNGGHPYFSPIYYECNFTIPQKVIDFSPENRLLMEPNRFLFFDGTGTEETTSTFSIPIARGTGPRQATGKSRMEPESQFDRWCLTFSYYMVGLPLESFTLSVNREFDLWEAVGKPKSWNEALVNIPASDIKYDLVFSVMKRASDAGFVAMDNVTINHIPCARPQSYVTGFDDSNLDANSFFVFGEVQHETIQPLYERRRSDPIIIKSRPESSGVISYTPTDFQFGFPPIVESPSLPAISNYYPVYCLSVEYRQRTRQGRITVGVRGIQDFDAATIRTHVLTQVASVRPWLTLKVEVNSSISLATENLFVIVLQGLEGVWLNSMAVDTLPCSQVERGGKCNNGVQCLNGRCVHPDQMCDGLNHCGDWSDEIGCPSHCGTIADVFDPHTMLLMNKTNDHPVYGKQCFWRVHGKPGKQVLLDIGPSLRSKKDKFMLIVYRGFSPIADALIFPEASKVFQQNLFSKPSTILIDESEVTITLTFNRKIVLPAIKLNVTIVDPTHCKFVCPDLTCLTDNYQCDGKVGCPDASDEANCTRTSNLFGEKLLEVRRLNGKFSLLCGDDVTLDVANAACQQLGYSKAMQPLRFISLPKKLVGFSHYRIATNLTDQYPQYLQGHLASPVDGTFGFPAQGVGHCSSGSVWVADCVPYQCGVRSIERPQARKPILKIVGGNKTPRGYWPWIASLQGGGVHLCGGTLISDRHVITAAHCFDMKPALEFKVILGTNDLDPLDSGAMTFSVIDAVSHENYNDSAEIPDWDIALLELDRTVKFTKYISPACLPSGNIRFRPGDMCYIAGYGYLEDHGENPLNLFNARTPILSRSDCNQNYNNKISSRMICAGYPKTGTKGICHGDSGGPLVCESDDGQWHLAGVISWSIGCAEIKKPDVFANVQYFIGWINQYTNMNLTLPVHQQPGICGGTFYGANQGTFASPGWPSFYPPDQTCAYRIIAAPGQSILIEFDTFALEQDYDFVTIYRDGIDPRNVFMRLTGNKSGGVFEINSSTVVFLFESDSDLFKAGFFTKWSTQGKPQNYTGKVEPVVVSGSDSSSQSLTLLLVSGEYRHVGYNAYRPVYKQVELPSSVLPVPTYELFFYEPLGQWRLFPTGGEQESSVWLYSNDSSVLPTDIRVSWNVWTGSSWKEIDLRIDVPLDPIPSTTLEVATTTNQTHTANDKQENVTCTTRTFTETSGVISTDGFPDFVTFRENSTCLWRIDPKALGSADGSLEGRTIILLVDYYDLEEKLEIYAGDEVSGQPLAFVEARSAMDGNFISDIRGESGSGNNPTEAPTTHSPTTTAPLLTQADINRIAGQIAAQPQCLHSFTRFSANTCSSDLYTMFENNENEGVTTLLNCSLFIKCGNVSWCNLVSFLADVPSHISWSEATENYCLDPLWVPPAPTNLPIIDGIPINDGIMGNSIPIRKPLIVFKDEKNEGLTLSLRLFNQTLPISIGFHISYHVTLVSSESSFNIDEYDVQTIGGTRSRRMIRSIKSALGLSFSRSTNFPMPIFVTRTPATTTAGPHSLQSTPESSASGVPLIRVELPDNVTCKGTFWKSEDRWFITSPNFPKEYDQDSKCMWQFRTVPGYQILLEFSTMFIEADSTCGYDGVSLYSGTNNESPRIGRFCDQRNSFIPPQLSAGHEMFIHFYSDHYVHPQGFMASLITHQIPQKEERSSNQTVLFSCDFDADECGFEHDFETSEFTWAKNNYSTPSDKTGPPYDDSATRDGHYMYIEASAPQQKGDRARMLTPVLSGDPDAARCLHFSYDMYGGAHGFLNVYAILSLQRNYTESELEDDGTESVASTEPLAYLYGSGIRDKTTEENSESRMAQRFLLWSRSDQQRRFDESPWMTASVTFYPFNNFRIMFEGVRGRTFESDTAVDNVEVLEGECEKKCVEDGQHQCLTAEGLTSEGECVPKVVECDGVRDCMSGSDELFCVSALRQMCSTETIPANTTEALVCDDKNVDRCALRDPSLNKIRHFTCDGINDCFGGYDEALCNVQSPDDDESVASALDDDCGVQSSNDELDSRFPNVPNMEHWKWVVGMYVAKPDVMKEYGDTGGTTSSYTFVCSAVFIQVNWAVVPAHCILNPNLYDSYTKSLYDADKIGPDGELLAEFDDAGRYPDAPSTFSYILISSKNPDLETERPLTWRVSRWFLHPDYVSASTAKRNSTEDVQSVLEKFDSLLKDADKAYNDVALLKVELDDELLSTEISVETDSGDVPEEEDVFYETLNDAGMNITNHEPRMSACLESNSNTKTGRRRSSKTSIFPLPEELERHPTSLSEPQSGKPKRAHCFAIGHSAIKSEAEDERLVWSLRQSKVFVTSSEKSAPHLFCETYPVSETRQLCMNSLLENSGPTSSDGGLKLNTVIRAGYKSVKTSAYLNDPGVALFCKRHDNRWFLSGLSSWINFNRNFVTPNYTSILNNMHSSALLSVNSPVWPNDDPTLGVSLGTNYFMQVGQTHVEWIERMLKDACPGQFTCNPVNSRHPIKCIPHEFICDGKVDCPLNNADERNCTSGCSYDPKKDPRQLYYSRLASRGVDLPDEQLVVDHTSFDDARRSWRNNTVIGVKRIRFNEVDYPAPTSCRWVIKPPQGKVAILRIPKMNVNPIRGGGTIRVIQDDDNMIHDHTTSSSSYISSPGKPIAFLLAPPTGEKLLKGVRSRYFEYFFDDVGLCTGMHKCLNGKCVSMHKVCDGELDCDDMSDEIGCPSGCGGPSVLATQPQGQISSRNYPLPHHGSGDCVWMVISNPKVNGSKGPTETSISIQFSEFSTAHGRDLLYVYEGVGKDKILQDVFHGQKGPFSVGVQSNRATIILRSNDYISNRRFKATFYVNALEPSE